MHTFTLIELSKGWRQGRIQHVGYLTDIVDLSTLAYRALNSALVCSLGHSTIIARHNVHDMLICAWDTGARPRLRVFSLCLGDGPHVDWADYFAKHYAMNKEIVSE
jgi:hypothetical protein